MSMMISASDGSGAFAAYVAEPAAAPIGTIIVIQEIFGVNAGIRTMCDQWAADGFRAVAPDLFWRTRPGIELDPRIEAELMQGFALYQGFNVDTGISDIQATITAARALPGSMGGVGVVGFCLGGLLAYLTATRTDADACVGYYGVGIQNHLDEAAAITAPTLLHIATADSFVDAAAQAQLHAGLAGNRQVTLHDYPGQQHAFSRIDGEHYDAASALLARGRTLALFRAALA